MAPTGHARGSRRLATRLVAALAAVAATGLAGCASGGSTLPLISSSSTPSAASSASSTGSSSAATTPPSSSVPPLDYPGPHPGPRLQALIDQIQASDVVPMRLFARHPGPREVYLCRVGLYGQDGPHTLYADVLCGDYLTGPKAEQRSASRLDMVLTVTGTGAKTRIVSYRTPDQATIQQDYRTMFPPRILAIIHDVQSGIRPNPLRPTLDQILFIARNSS